MQYPLMILCWDCLITPSNTRNHIGVRKIVRRNHGTYTAAAIGLKSRQQLFATAWCILETAANWSFSTQTCHAFIVGSYHKNSPAHSSPEAYGLTRTRSSAQEGVDADVTRHLSRNTCASKNTHHVHKPLTWICVQGSRKSLHAQCC